MSENRTPEEQKAEVDRLLNLDPSEASQEDIVAMQKMSKSSFEQKSHLKDKADKAIDPETGNSYRSILHEMKQSKDKDNQDPKKTVANDDKKDEKEERIMKLELSEEKRTFGHENNLTPEETDHVFSHAKGTGMTPAEALESPFIKSGLDALRKQKINDNASLSPSSKASKVGDKNFHDMDKKDKREHYGTVVKNILKK